MISNTKQLSFKLLLIFVFISLLMGVIHLSLQYINIQILNEEYGPVFELTNRFDLDDEISVGTWISQFMYLLLFGLSFLAARLTKQKTKKIVLWVIAAGALLGSIDEVAGLHEFVLQSVHNLHYVDQAPTAAANAWWIVLPFILAAATILLYFIKQAFDTVTLVLFGTGLTIFIFGAVLVDQITSYVSASPFISQGIFVAIEEIFELIGLSIFIFAISRFVEMNYRKQLSSALKHIKS